MYSAFAYIIVHVCIYKHIFCIYVYFEQCHNTVHVHDEVGDLTGAYKCVIILYVPVEVTNCTYSEHACENTHVHNNLYSEIDFYTCFFFSYLQHV